MRSLDGVTVLGASLALGVLGLGLVGLGLAHRRRRAGPDPLDLEVGPAGPGGPAPPLDVLERRLRDAGMAVVRRWAGPWPRRRRLDVAGTADARAFSLEVPDPARVQAAALGPRASDERVALAALHALVPALGPLTVRLRGAEVVIDGTRSLQDAQRALEAQRRRTGLSRPGGLRTCGGSSGGSSTPPSRPGPPS